MFSAKLFSASRAIGNHIVAADFGATGFDAVFLNCVCCRVASCGDLVNVDLFAASCAIKRLTACNRTCGLRIDVPFTAIIVSKCGNRCDILLRSAPRAIHGFAACLRTGGLNVHRPSAVVIMLTLCSGQYLHFQQLLTQGANASLHLGRQTGCRFDHRPSTQHMAANVIDRRAA